MSTRAEKYVRGVTCALAGPRAGKRISSAKRLVLQALARHFRDELGSAFGPVAYFAAQCGFASEVYCRRLMAELEEDGLLRRMAFQRASDGSRTTNEYDFPQMGIAAGRKTKGGAESSPQAAEQAARQAAQAAAERERIRAEFFSVPRAPLAVQVGMRCAPKPRRPRVCGCGAGLFGPAIALGRCRACRVVAEAGLGKSGESSSPPPNYGGSPPPNCSGSDIVVSSVLSCDDPSPMPPSAAGNGGGSVEIAPSLATTGATATATPTAKATATATAKAPGQSGGGEAAWAGAEAAVGGREAKARATASARTSAPEAARALGERAGETGRSSGAAAAIGAGMADANPKLVEFPRVRRPRDGWQRAAALPRTALDGLDAALCDEVTRVLRAVGVSGEALRPAMTAALALQVERGGGSVAEAGALLEARWVEYFDGSWALERACRPREFLREGVWLRPGSWRVRREVRDRLQRGGL